MSQPRPGLLDHVILEALSMAAHEIAVAYKPVIRATPAGPKQLQRV